MNKLQLSWTDFWEQSGYDTTTGLYNKIKQQNSLDSSFAWSGWIDIFVFLYFKTYHFRPVFDVANKNRLNTVINHICDALSTLQ